MMPHIPFYFTRHLPLLFTSISSPKALLNLSPSLVIPIFFAKCHFLSFSLTNYHELQFLFRFHQLGPLSFSFSTVQHPILLRQLWAQQSQHKVVPFSGCFRHSVSLQWKLSAALKKNQFRVRALEWTCWCSSSCFRPLNCKAWRNLGLNVCVKFGVYPSQRHWNKRKKSSSAICFLVPSLTRSLRLELDKRLSQCSWY